MTETFDVNQTDDGVILKAEGKNSSSIQEGIERPSLLNLENIARYLVNNHWAQEAILGTVFHDEETLMDWLADNHVQMDEIVKRVSALVEAQEGNLDFKTEPKRVIDLKN